MSNAAVAAVPWSGAIARSVFFVFAAAAAAQEPTPQQVALERAVPSPAPTQGSAAGQLRLIDLSLDVSVAAGTSTERDAELRVLEGGDHDPHKRGFTLQQAELSFAGAVDPWFTAKATLVATLDADDGATSVELEEAHLTTTRLPAGLELRVGAFLTEFGRLNATHPHAWDWLDQPVIATRVFGGDGMRGPGARLSWLLPAEQPVEVLFAVQNANGETMTSSPANEEVYAERPIGGRQFTPREVRSGQDLTWSARATTSFELGEETTLRCGVSGAFGPNATGDDADTVLWGADFGLRWRPATGRRSDPWFDLRGEYVARAFTAAAQTDASDPLAPVALPRTTLHDFGGWLQGLYGFDEYWSAGLRVEYATGNGESYVGGGSFARAADPFRDDRLRIAPLVQWRTSEFARVRLQYDYDDADHLDHAAHSVWLGFEVLIGAHPAHTN